MGGDYRDSFITIGEQMRERPLKAAVYIGLSAGAIHMSNTNPTELDLRSRLQEHMNASAMMSDKIRNKEVDNKLNHFVDCYNRDTLRRLNLVLFSLAWEDNFSSECGLFRATVSHLKPRYFTFFQERVLDVGFLGRWWYLEKLVDDVDVNVDEWDEEGRQKPGFGPKKTSTMGMV